MDPSSCDYFLILIHLFYINIHILNFILNIKNLKIMSYLNVTRNT
jgi:hypothetical protein